MEAEKATAGWTTADDAPIESSARHSLRILARIPARVPARVPALRFDATEVAEGGRWAHIGELLRG